MNHILWPIVAVALASAPGVGPAAAGEPVRCSAALPGQLRILDAQLAADVAHGIERSATLRGLVDRVGALGGIVYVSTTIRVNADPHRVLLGGLIQDVTVAGDYRILRLLVVHKYGDDAVATVAHELKHALEVLEESSIRTPRDVTALFRQIGDPVSPGVWETSAAVSTEAVVAGELRESRHSIHMVPTCATVSGR